MKIFAFRVDSNNLIGSGHITRCITFAKNIRNSKIYFLVKDLGTYYENQLKKLKYKIIFLEKETNTRSEVNQILYFIDLFNISKLFVDLYDCPTNYTNLIGKNFKNTFLIESKISKQHKVNTIINIYNNKINKKLYYFFKKNNVRILNNCQHNFIDKFFYQKKKITSKIKEKFKIIITFGGLDKYNITQTLVEIFSEEKYNHFNFTFVVGYFNQNKNSLPLLKKSNIEILYNPKNFKEILAVSDLYIGAAGMTLYQSIYLNIPSIVINTNRKQKKFIDFLRENKLLIFDCYHTKVFKVDFIKYFNFVYYNDKIKHELKKNVNKNLNNKREYITK